MTRVTIVVAALLAGAGCTNRADSYAFTEIAYPGATSTAAAGINSAGHIVGWYQKGDRTYGFLYKDGTYSSIQYPGAGFTQLTGIADNGDLAGAYRMPDETHPFAYHGFVLTRSGEYRLMVHPEYKYGMAMRVLADGSIIGCYHNETMASMRSATVPGSVLAGGPGAVKLLDLPASMHNGGTPDGTKTVGALTERGEAYVIDRGALTTFKAPNTKLTEAWDVNRSGVIVGVLEEGDSVTHGYVLRDGRYTRIDVPNAKSTVTFGINDKGEIVGSFDTADGQRRGYRATSR